MGLSFMPYLTFFWTRVSFSDKDGPMSNKDSSRYIAGRIFAVIALLMIILIFFGWILKLFEAFHDPEKAIGLAILVVSFALIIFLFCWAFPRLKQSLERNADSRSFGVSLKRVLFGVIALLLGLFILYAACSVTNSQLGFRLW